MSISIHALREEGDVDLQHNFVSEEDFYPRPPRGGRHQFNRFRGVDHLISIHALREEGDKTRACAWR